MTNDRFQFEFDDDPQRASGELSREIVVEGNLLIASPYLHSSPFDKTVILLIQHNNDGSFGVVLNRAADESARDAWRELTGLDVGSRIVAGGPVGGPVFAIHKSAAMAEIFSVTPEAWIT